MVLDISTEITLGIAIYGAFLSTVGVIWNICNKIQDKKEKEKEKEKAMMVSPINNFLKNTCEY